MQNFFDTILTLFDTSNIVFIIQIPQQSATR